MGFRNWEIEMRSVIRWVQSSLGIACALIALVGNVSAGVIVDIFESGSDVVVNVSGSIRPLGNFLGNGGGTLKEAGIGKGSFNICDNSSSSSAYSAAYVGPGPAFWANDYTMNYTGMVTLSGVKQLAYVATNPFNGDGRFILGGYTFDTPITGTATFLNKTLADLGITTLGTYEFEVGDVGTFASDTLTFNIGGGSAVPEPTSACIGLLMIGGGILRRLRSSKRVVV